MNDVVLLIMTGGPRASFVERLVTEAREAATLDTVERALAAPAISRVIVATDSEALAQALSGRGVIVDRDPPGGYFHYGQRLLELIRRYDIQRILYLGGGSGVLLSTAELNRMAQALSHAERLVILNNFFSTDFAGWTPADCLADLLSPRFDNELGWLLGEVAALPTVVLKRSAATQFDMDTPTDLLTVSRHPAVGPHLRAYLDRLALDTSRLDRALEFFNDSRAEVILIGRVGAATWSYLETETLCRIRVFAEERGMRADGRLFRAEARSLLGFLMERIGFAEGFKIFAQLGQAAFMDTRVLWAHFARWPSPADRFASDLGLVGEIQDDWLREFTRAAIEAPLPIVLGGHSLVAGGMYALVEAALAASHAEPRRRPDLLPSSPDPLELWLKGCPNL